MAVSPVFEAILVPKAPNASIVRIVVRMDDPKNLTDTESVLQFLEVQFPFYDVQHVIAGYKQLVN